jgi:hypothetical protein
MSARIRLLLLGGCVLIAALELPRTGALIAQDVALLGERAALAAAVPAQVERPAAPEPTPHHALSVAVLGRERAGD